MKVAIFHELLTQFGGAERVAKVFSEMFPEAPIFTLLYDNKKCEADFPRSRVRVASGLQRAFSLGVPRRFLIGSMPNATENFDFSEFDLVISSSSAFAHGAITMPEARHICYCHSPARYLWDSSFAVQNEQAQRGFFAPIKAAMLPSLFFRLRQWDFVAGARPDCILANSNTVRARVEKFWRRKAKVLFPPVATDFFSPQKKHDDFFLIVSALSPFKNIDLAIRVFSRLPKHRLVIIGDGAERRYLHAIAGNNVELLGRKSDEVVREYMHRCRAFVFPSFDDFGIAPVEVMAAGKPVIALRKGGATETVVADKTGVFFDEVSEKSLSDALVHFFEQEKNFNAEEIAEHAEQFSEQNFRKAFLQKIEERYSSSHLKK